MAPDAAIHPLAPHDLPSFVTAPGETDVLLVAMLLVLIGAVLMVGNLYFQLHSLPERMAHRTNRVQIEIVAVLCLLALFTHEHIFWIAALLLAMIQFPDFSTPLNRIADSLEDRRVETLPTREAVPASVPATGPEELHAVSPEAKPTGAG